jgi:hypothetical protein
MLATKEGDDAYETNMPLYVMIWIVIFLYVGLFMMSIPVIMNQSVPHTYFAPGMFGTLYTQRYISTNWFFFAFGALRIIFIVSVLGFIRFRQSRGCSVFWFTLMIILGLLDLVIVLNAWLDYSRCNVPGYADNPCHDLLYCCVPDVHSVASSGCYNVVSCMPPNPTTLSELQPRNTFVWYFWLSVGALVLDMILIFVPLFLWIETK